MILHSASTLVPLCLSSHPERDSVRCPFPRLAPLAWTWAERESVTCCWRTRCSLRDPSLMGSWGQSRGTLAFINNRLIMLRYSATYSSQNSWRSENKSSWLGETKKVSDANRSSYLAAQLFLISHLNTNCWNFSDNLELTTWRLKINFFTSSAYFILGPLSLFRIFLEQ